MPIQFHCSNCGQPIEVDDQHAGQTAACPYCRHLVSVPQQSTYHPQPGSAPPADSPIPPPSLEPGAAETPSRPTLGTAPIPRPPVAPEQPSRQHTAATFGTYALICAGLIIVLVVTLLIMVLPVSLKIAAAHPGRNPTPEDVTTALQNTPSGPLIQGLGCGVPFFALVGLALSIVSLVQSRTNNWRGWVALAICGGAALCLCGMIVLVVLISAAGGIKPG